MSLGIFGDIEANKLRPRGGIIRRAIIAEVKRRNPDATDEKIHAAIAEIEAESGQPIIDFIKGIDWAKLIELILKIIALL